MPIVLSPTIAPAVGGSSRGLFGSLLGELGSELGREVVPTVRRELGFITPAEELTQAEAQGLRDSADQRAANEYQKRASELNPADVHYTEDKLKLGKRYRLIGEDSSDARDPMLNIPADVQSRGAASQQLWQSRTNPDFKWGETPTVQDMFPVAPAPPASEQEYWPSNTPANNSGNIPYPNPSEEVPPSQPSLLAGPAETDSAEGPPPSPVSMQGMDQVTSALADSADAEQHGIKAQSSMRSGWSNHPDFVQNCSTSANMAINGMAPNDKKLFASYTNNLVGLSSMISRVAEGKLDNNTFEDLTRLRSQTDDRLSRVFSALDATLGVEATPPKMQQLSDCISWQTVHDPNFADMVKRGAISQEKAAALQAGADRFATWCDSSDNTWARVGALQRLAQAFLPHGNALLANTQALANLDNTRREGEGLDIRNRAGQLANTLTQITLPDAIRQARAAADTSEVQAFIAKELGPQQAAANLDATIQQTKNANQALGIQMSDLDLRKYALELEVYKLQYGRQMASLQAKMSAKEKLAAGTIMAHQKGILADYQVRKEFMTSPVYALETDPVKQKAIADKIAECDARIKAHTAEISDLEKAQGASDTLDTASVAAQGYRDHSNQMNDTLTSLTARLNGSCLNNPLAPNGVMDPSGAKGVPGGGIDWSDGTIFMGKTNMVGWRTNKEGKAEFYSNLPTSPDLRRAAAITAYYHVQHGNKCMSAHEFDSLPIQGKRMFDPTHKDKSFIAPGAEGTKEEQAAHLLYQKMYNYYMGQKTRE